MVRIKSFPNNQDVYIGAESVMKWLHGRTSGVFGNSNNLGIYVVPNSMSVEIEDGIGWMANNNGDGIVFWNDAEQTTGSQLRLTLDAADGALNRIDRVIVSWETTNYVALPTISILSGTPSNNPTAPILTNNNIIRQISLAQILVPAGTVSLSSAMITDERLNPNVCGIVTENVKIDTSTMQNQFESLLFAIKNELANITGGTGFDLSPIREKNVIVERDFFETFSSVENEETKILNSGYIYRAFIPVSGVLETMTPYLTFSISDVDNSGISILNQFCCTDGGVYVYANGIPNENITILTAEFRKPIGENAVYEGVSTLSLNANNTTSTARALIDGNNYGVENAVVTKDNELYNFTVI